jgi:hypothetical protein
VALIDTTKVFIFGGFPSISWDLSNSYKSDPSQKSFLFTLNECEQYIAPRTFKLSNASNPIYSGYNCELIFDNGHDIQLSDELYCQHKQSHKFGSRSYWQSRYSGKNEVINKVLRHDECVFGRRILK